MLHSKRATCCVVCVMSAAVGAVVLLQLILITPRFRGFLLELAYTALQSANRACESSAGQHRYSHSCSCACSCCPKCSSAGFRACAYTGTSPCSSASSSASCSACSSTSCSACSGPGTWPCNTTGCPAGVHRLGQAPGRRAAAECGKQTWQLLWDQDAAGRGKLSGIITSWLRND